MNLRLVFSLVGLILIIIGVSMLAPLFWAIYFGSQDKMAFIISATVTTVIGMLLYHFLKSKKNDIRYKEGFAIVSLSWIFASVFGSLPYLISGAIPDFSGALFETMSGFTTTGSSVVTDIEALPKGILFWRSLTHWLGGMGIVVLFVAILSSIGAGGLQIFKAESPGPVAEKIKPKISETAKILWFTYLIFTIFEVFLLRVGGMSFFDSLCHTFGTLATGGFSTKNLSIGYYNDYYTQWVIIIFMAISGVNFALYYGALHNKSLRNFWRSEEFRLYIFIITMATIFTSIILAANNNSGDGIFKIITDSAFQVVSIVTTTGYATADFDKWPEVLRVLLFSLMFVGGCAGSTGGSIKVGRILVLFKQMYQELKKAVHPKIVTKAKIRGKVIEDKVVLNILQFFFIYIFIFIISSIIMSLMGLDYVSALTSVAASIGNIGPGLNLVGPAQNYAFISDCGKYFLTFLMLLGRLELYTVLVLFSPIFWKK